MRTFVEAMLTHLCVSNVFVRTSIRNALWCYQVWCYQEVHDLSSRLRPLLHLCAYRWEASCPHPYSFACIFLAGVASTTIRANYYTPEITNSEISLERATYNPLEHSSVNSLGKWQSFGNYHWQVTTRWTMPMKIHNDFRGADFWCAILYS